jgi:hypothetical protein
MNVSNDIILEKIIYKIRNMLRLSNEELNYIKYNLSNNQKQKIIELFNEIAITNYYMLLLSK